VRRNCIIPSLLGVAFHANVQHARLASVEILCGIRVRLVAKIADPRLLIVVIRLCHLVPVGHDDRVLLVNAFLRFLLALRFLAFIPYEAEDAVTRREHAKATKEQETD